jgi:hypothetical protein
MPEPAAPYYRRTGNTTNGLPQGTQVYPGGLLSGSGWTAQLFAAPGADQPENALLASAAITTFRTGSAAGFSATVIAVLTNVPADSPVATVQIRVWDNSSGLYPTWASGEWGHFSGSVAYIGKSPLFNVEAIGGGTNPPAILRNLRSFSLYGDYQNYPPVILSQPKNQAVSAGNDVNFIVDYVSPGFLHYRWRHNGNVIVEASTSFPFYFTEVLTNVLHLTNVQASQAGMYSVEMVNPYVSPFSPKPVEAMTTFSSNAVLTVGNPGAFTVSRDQLSRVRLNWDGVFFLQTATNAAGPFTDLPGPIVFSPYTNTDLAGPRFFRLRN